MLCDRCGRNLTLKNGEDRPAMTIPGPRHLEELYPELYPELDQKLGAIPEISLCYVCVLNAYGLQPPVLI